MWARIIAAVDAWQRAHVVIGFPIAVIKKFGEDRASNLAALMAYYAFLSLFPLLLVFVSVLGFLLADNPTLQQTIVDSAVSRIPLVGTQLDDEVQPLTGSVPALIIGIVGALWAGLGVTLVLGRAFNQVWNVPRYRQRGAVGSRLYAVAALGVLGVALVGSTLLTGLAIGGAIGPGLQRLLAITGAFVANTLVLLIIFGLLTARPFRIAELLPGVSLAAVGLIGLQSVGTVYVNRTVADSTDTYGTFALVIGLLSWFWLGAHVLLFAAEINVVVRRRLWPRALTGELTVADREAFRRLAEASRRDEREQITVHFDDDGDDPAPGDVHK